MKQEAKSGLFVVPTGLSQNRPKHKNVSADSGKSGLEADLSPYLYGDENGQAGTARSVPGLL